MTIELNNIISISIYSSFAILIVFALRRIIHKFPAKYRLWLWLPILVQLLVPIKFSITHSAYRVLPEEKISKTLVYYVFDGNTIAEQTQLHATQESLEAFDWIRFAMIIWLIGCLVCALYRIFVVIRFQREMQHNSYQDGRIQMLGRNLVKEDTVYSFVVTNRIQTSAVFGVIHPKILISDMLLTKTDEDIQTILLHEITHIRKGHPYLNCMLELVKSIYWFNPLIYLMTKAIREDMECIVDYELINRYAINQRSYALLLMNMASEQRNLQLMCIKGKSSLVKERIVRIMENRKLSVRFAAIGIIFMLFGGYCLLTPKAEELVSVEEASMHQTDISLSYRNLENPMEFDIEEEEKVVLKLTIPEITDTEFEAINFNEVEAYVDFEGIVEDGTYQFPINVDWGENEVPENYELNYDTVAFLFTNLSDKEEFIDPVDNPHVTCGWYCYAGHMALDIQNEGDNYGSVYAVKSGYIIENEYDTISGWHVIIQHNEQEQSYYEQLKEESPWKVGDYVTQGEVIGNIGMSGKATGPHLHFGISIDGNRVDPAKYLPFAKN